MERKTILDILGLAGLILTASGFIEKLTPYLRYPFLIIGVVTIGLYFKFYYDERIIRLINKNKENIDKIQLENKEKMSFIQEKLSKLEGWKEAVEHFYKKSQIDPIILVIILVIIIIIIILFQKGG